MDTQVLFSGIKQGIAEREKDVKKNRVFMRAVIKYQKIAAVILLPFIAFSVYITLNQINQDQAYFETIAESGQKSTLVLPDGTKVWLNSDSRLRYPDTFGKRNRTVQLTGEAYFEVAKDKRRPFLVEAGEVNIRVLGTTFNIKAYPDENEIETILLEGSIELTARLDAKSALKPVIMEPGQSLRFNKVENKLQHIPFDKEEVLGWTNNRLIFRNDSFDSFDTLIDKHANC